ncbi:MAG: NAD(P)H-binding protein [Anaerolineales bacterium]|nr:NAD(P)H-binding protein [Anaerolineales bacterium]
MILVTGGTGFIGRVLIRHLVENGYQVRTLIRPSPRSPNLPRGVSVDVAVSSLNDERGLRAAMVGIDTVFHLASAERGGPRADLMHVDIQGTRAVAEAASDAGVERLFYLSHLGADRASAYAVLKSKAIAEEFVRRSGLDYTVVRTALVFGVDDGFTTSLAQILSSLPFLFLLPGDGSTLLQPLWVEDLATCLVWSLENPEMRKRTIDIGGAEYLSLRQVIEAIMAEINTRRVILGIPPPYLRGLTVILHAMFPHLPVSAYWLDYLAANRTTALDTLPRVFNLMPARLSQQLAYLRGQSWRSSLLRLLLDRQKQP